MKKIISLLVVIMLPLFADWSSLLGSFAKSDTAKSVVAKTTGSNDTILAIKDALKEGTKYAINNLSKKNGFLSNKNVSIPLPPSLKKAASIVSKYGGQSYIDSFKASINHAAEKAVPATYGIFENSIKNLSVNDAKRLLKGGDGSITKFFRDKNSKELYQKIYPIVKNSIRKIDVMSYYNSFKGYYEKYMPKVNLSEKSNSLLNMAMNFAKQSGASKYMIDLSEKSLDDYVTKKSIDGLFYMIAQEESKIRKNPLQATSSIVKKVFSTYMKN